MWITFKYTRKSAAGCIWGAKTQEYKLLVLRCYFFDRWQVNQGICRYQKLNYGYLTVKKCRTAWNACLGYIQLKGALSFFGVYPYKLPRFKYFKHTHAHVPMQPKQTHTPARTCKHTLVSNANNGIHYIAQFWHLCTCIVKRFY